MSIFPLNCCQKKEALGPSPIDTSHKKLRMVWQLVGQASAKIFQFFFEVKKNWEKLDEEASKFFRKRRKPRALDPRTGPYKFYRKGFGVDNDIAKPTKFVTRTGDIVNKIAFIGINGVRVNLEYAKTHADHLSKILDKKITFIHNPTLSPFRDTYRYAVEAFCRWITPTSLLLKREMVKKIKGGKKVIVFPHSAGCPALRNALLLMSESQRKKVHVIAVAPGSYIDPKLCGSIVNLISPLDPIPYFDIKGMHIYRDTIERLLPRLEDNIHDHYIYGKTYEKRLREITDLTIEKLTA